MLKIRRVLILAAIFVSALALGLTLVFWYLNLDKTQVFFDAAGTLGRVEIFSTTTSIISDVHYLRLYNTRNEFLVDCWYRRPRTLAADYRVLLVYTGVTTKEAILDLIPDRPDVVLCVVQYPYEPPKKWFEYIRWPRTIRNAAFRVVGGGMLAVTYLTEREKLDPARLTVVGASLGSIFGGIHGAIDTRIPRTLIVHGGGNFHTITKSYSRLRERGWPVRLSAWLGVRIFGTFDPLNYVDRISPRELVILAATHDMYFPPESAQSLYDRAKDPKKIIWMNTEHVKSQKSEILNSILHSLKSYLFSDTTP